MFIRGSCYLVLARKLALMQDTVRGPERTFGNSSDLQTICVFSCLHSYKYLLGVLVVVSNLLSLNTLSSIEIIWDRTYGLIFLQL